MCFRGWEVFVMFLVLLCWGWLAADPASQWTYTPAPGWSAEPVESETGLVFRASHALPEAASMLQLRVSPAGDEGLDDIWLRFRYSVVVSLGGRIVSERSGLVNGRPARTMVYRGVSATSGRQRTFYRVDYLMNGELYEFHGAADPAAFPRERPAMEKMVTSLRAASARDPQSTFDVCRLTFNV